MSINQGKRQFDYKVHVDSPTPGGGPSRNSAVGSSGAQNPNYSNPSTAPPPYPYAGPHEAEQGTAAFAGNSFDDKIIRSRFVRKVYLILSCQFVVTFAFICVFVLVKPINDYMTSSESSVPLILYIISYVLFIITLIIMMCVEKLRRTTPYNFICLCIFTVVFSYMVAMISAFHKTEIVLIAAGLTFGITVGITIFACQTKIDFTMCYGLLFALLLALFLAFWTGMIAYWASPSDVTFDVWRYVYGGLGAIVFSFILVIDTQLLLGGRKLQLSEEEYIFAAVQIYIDVMYIFLYLLMILGGGKK